MTEHTTNTGKGKLKGAKAVDDLSKVLGNATLLAPLAPELTQSGNNLTWAIPNLAPGQSVQVSYRVKVKPYSGHIKLVNVVAPTTPGGSCLPGQCSTTHSGGGGLAVTGARTNGVLAGMLVLLGVGVAAIYGDKRRKSTK